MATTYTAEWWRDILDGVTETTDGFMARCPAHDDHNPSLHITTVKDGKPLDPPLYHCFAGCTRDEIIAAVEQATTLEAPRVKPPKGVVISDPRQWWEDYTGVPWLVWAKLGARCGVDQRGAFVAFYWQGVQAEKIRYLPKHFQWTEGSNKPLFWPKMERRLPKRVYITEGESDCGVLRHLGFDAYAETKGAAERTPTATWKELKRRGVDEVVLVADIDKAGEHKVETSAAGLRAAGLRVAQLDVSALVDLPLGEKDIRDAWKRMGPDLVDEIESHIVPLDSVSAGWTRLSTFMASPVPEAQWLIKHIMLSQTVGMIVGAPKMFKSWFCMDFAISVASGLPLFGEFEIGMPSPVVLITKEDPDYLMHDRMWKILHAKGLTGRMERLGTNRLRLALPRDIPVYLDLNRTFLFDQANVDTLMARLREVRDLHNQPPVVVIDPLLRMIEADPDAINNATEVSKMIFAPCERITTELGGTVLLAHHKGKGQTDGKQSYGSVGFHAFSACTQYLLGDDKDKDGWVHVQSEFKSAPGEKWAYRFNGDLNETYAPEIFRGAKPASRTDQVRDTVLLALKGGDTLSLDALAESTGAPKAAISDVLQDLVAHGLVSEGPDNEIRATEKGRKRKAFRLNLSER